MIEQRLRNRFPISSKLRQDPSSFGARLFSVFGDYYDFAYAEIRRTAEDRKLIKHGLGIGYIYSLVLDEADHMTYTLSNSGKPIWTYPTVVGTSGGDYTLTRVEDLDSLCWTVPNRASVGARYGIENHLVYSDDRDGTVVSNVIDYPSQLTVVIGPSLNFYKKTSLRNVKASGQHLLLIKGKDSNGSPITERLFVRDDGIYQTANVFTEVEEVVPEGFSGPFYLYVGQATTYIVDPFRVCVTEDGEGPLKLSITAETNSIGNTARLYYYTDLILNGEDYRDGSVEVSPNERDKWEQYLRSATDTVFTPVDIAINPNSTRLYVLDSTGTVHIYNHGPTPFGVPSDQDSLTKTAYLEIIPVKYWARVDEDMTLFTRWARRRYPIRGVTIKRISPSNTVEYLQANKTWNASTYEFPGNETFDGLVENSWNDFSFTTTFDEFGTWEFYCIVRTKYDTTVSYTGVMLDAKSAEVSLALGITNPTAVWFGPDNHLLISSTNNGLGGEANSIYPVTEYADLYLADTDNQILYLRESYDSVEVS